MHVVLMSARRRSCAGQLRPMFAMCSATALVQSGRMDHVAARPRHPSYTLALWRTPCCMVASAPCAWLSLHRCVAAKQALHVFRLSTVVFPGKSSKNTPRSSEHVKSLEAPAPGGCAFRPLVPKCRQAIPSASSCLYRCASGDAWESCVWLTWLSLCRIRLDASALGTAESSSCIDAQPGTSRLSRRRSRCCAACPSSGGAWTEAPLPSHSCQLADGPTQVACATRQTGHART